MIEKPQPYFRQIYVCINSRNEDGDAQQAAANQLTWI